jgi:hypothetical protein
MAIHLFSTPGQIQAGVASVDEMPQSENPARDLDWRRFPDTSN